MSKVKIKILDDSVWRARYWREQRKRKVQVPDFEHIYLFQILNTLQKPYFPH